MHMLWAGLSCLLRPGKRTYIEEALRHGLLSEVGLLVYLAEIDDPDILVSVMAILVGMYDTQPLLAMRLLSAGALESLQGWTEGSRGWIPK